MRARYWKETKSSCELQQLKWICLGYVSANGVDFFLQCESIMVFFFFSKAPGRKKKYVKGKEAHMDYVNMEEI